MAKKHTYKKATGTGTQDTVLTATAETVITQILFLNQETTTQTVIVWHKKNGEALATKHKIYIDISIPSDDTATIPFLFLETSDALVFEATSANVYCHIDYVE